jgi:ATP-dependent RNA helicase SUPV3L1/SUV3
LVPALKSRLQQFPKNPTVRQKAGGLGVRGKLFTEISENFVKAALAGSIPRCRANEIYEIYNQEEGVGNTILFY